MITWFNTTPVNAAQSGSSPFGDVSDTITKGFENYYKPKQLAEDLLRQKLSNAMNKPKAEHAEEITLADLMNTRANTGLTTANTGLAEQNTRKQHILNNYLPKRESNEINEIAAREKYYLNGGGRGGVSAQNQTALQQQIKRDNPNFTDEQAFEAAGNLVSGKEMLNDGTPFNASGLTRLSAQKAVLQGNTAALTTQGTQAAQAESEIPVVDKYINEGNKPYGSTYFGYSPALAADSAKTNDAAAQERVGKKIAADFLNFDRAALAAKMSGTQSGVTIVNEMMHAAGQKIKESSFIKTQKAREVALNTVREALNKMLSARRKVGVLQAGLVPGQNNQNASNQFEIPNKEKIPIAIRSKLSEINFTDVPDGKIRIFVKGEGSHVIPIGKLNEAISDPSVSFTE